MSKSKSKKKGRVMWGFIYVVVFLTAFLASVVMKMTADPFHGKYTVIYDKCKYFIEYKARYIKIRAT